MHSYKENIHIITFISFCLEDIETRYNITEKKLLQLYNVLPKFSSLL